MRGIFAPGAILGALLAPISAQSFVESTESQRSIKIEQVTPRFDTAYQNHMSTNDAEWRKFLMAQGPQWRVQWDARTGVPRRIMGPGVRVSPVHEGNVAAVALNFVEAHAALLRVDVSDLQLAAANRVGKKWFVTLDRFYEGVPVEGARVDVRLMADGRVTLFGSYSHPDIDLESRPSMSASGAQALAAGSVGERASSQLAAEAQLRVLPLMDSGGVGYALVWEVDVPSSEEDALWGHHVDAHTGAIVSRWNRYRFAQIGGEIRGTILPASPTDPPEERPYKLHDVTIDGSDVVTADVDGIWEASVGSGDHDLSGRIVGTFARSTNMDGAQATYSGIAPANQRTDVVWDDNNSLIEERNVYYHTNMVHDYIKSVDENFRGLDYSMESRVNTAGSCNAFWDGVRMTFYKEGGSCADIAKIADVVYHEYGHGVVQHQNRRANGSMHEGFADYLAASVSRQPEIGRGFFGPGTNIRHCINNRVYPAPECGGGVHCVGEANCGALWDARTALVELLGEAEGVVLSDSLWHHANAGLANNEIDFYVDYLLVDDDDGDLSNGTPHGSELFPALLAHGFVQGLENAYSYTYDAVASDIVADPGDVMTLVSGYDLPLGAMAATGISATLKSGSPHVTVTKGSATLPDMNPGDRADNAADPFEFSVDANLEEMVDVQFEVVLQATPNFFSRVDTITVRLGRSDLLLVDDDPLTDYTSYYTEPLANLGHVPNILSMQSSFPLGFNKLLGFEAVIWITGDAEEATLVADDVAELAGYLDAGGHLLLAGQNIADDIQGEAFLADYLHASFVNGNAGVPLADGIAGDPLSSGWSFFFTGQGGANNWKSPDVVAALGDGRQILSYTGTENGAGVAYDGAYKSVFLAFNFEGVTGQAGTTTREEALGDILRSFDVAVGIQALELDGVATAEGNLLSWRLAGDGRAGAGVHVYRRDEDLRRLTEVPVVDSASWLDAEAAVDGIYRYRLGIVATDGTESLSEEFEVRRGELPGAPMRFALAQNAPNPFNPSTGIRFDLPRAEHVRLAVYDLSGRCLVRLVDEVRPSGHHRVRWDGRDASGGTVASGVYLYRLEAGDFVTSRRMVLVK